MFARSASRSMFWLRLFVFVYLLVGAACNAAAFAVTHQRSTVEASFQAQRSDVWVQASGTVQKVLADDNKGSRHQRFIVALPSGITVLIAHNIDLAPRLPDLKAGDTVEFYGEYEWNKKGGVVHWTHHHPRGRHAGGWLRYKGQLYR
jgi:hypothetical protein